MYETRIKKIFDFLTSDYDFHTADEMSMFLEFSNKTVRNEIKIINDIFKQAGASIQSIQKKGYRFVIENHLKFENFLKNDWHKYAFENENFNNRDYRINYILKSLLFSSDYIKSEYLIEKLVTSNSQFSQDLKMVKKILSDYGLNLESRPHYGIKIKGNELNIRQCISCCLPEYSYKEDFISKNDDFPLRRIKDIVYKIFSKYNYEINNLAFENIVVHFYVAMKRITQNYIVDMNDDILIKLSEKQEYTIAKEISEELSKEFGIIFPETEVAYIMTHIIAKQSIKNYQPSMIKESQDVVKNMICYIKTTMNIDFSDDEELISSLTLHIIPLIERLNYGLILKNPILDDIKSEIMAYEVATVSGTVINKKYNVNLIEDEIGYLALHFSVALLRMSSKKKKKNIIIICGSGKGTANLMKYSFLEEFGSYVSNLKTCGYIESQSIDLDEYDLIISAIKTEFKTIKPIIYVDNLLKKDDYINIKNNLENYERFEIKDLFDEDLFFYDFVVKDKTSALKKLCQIIVEKKGISQDLYEKVVKREELSSTELDNFIALPHPISSVTNHSFITIAILKKPILWKSKEVKLIIFLNISENESEEKLKIFYTKLADFMTSTSLISNSLKAKDLETFIKILDSSNEY